LAWDLLGKTWEKQIRPETLGNNISQSPYKKLRRRYSQTHLFTNTLPHITSINISYPLSQILKLAGHLKKSLIYFTPRI
jgi:hypothetical protein